MLRHSLSLREEWSGNSGPVARIAGFEIDADRFLPTMGTQEFLSCLSKPEMEAVAAANGVLPRQTGTATRAAVVDRFKDKRYVYPASNFAFSQAEITKLTEERAARTTNCPDGDHHAGEDDPEREGNGPSTADNLDEPDGEDDTTDPDDDPTHADAPVPGTPASIDQIAAE